MAVLAIAALIGATTQAATITGQNGYTATLYGNPFTGSSNTVGSNGAGTVVVENSIAAVVSQLDARSEGGPGTGRIRTDDGATNGYMRFVASASFKAGTVIGVQSAPYYFPAGLNYNLLLDGNSVQSSTTASTTTPIVVTTVAAAPTVQTLQLNMDMKPATGTPSFYSAMNEVLILPDALKEVASIATTPDPVAFPSEQVTGLNDHSGLYGWYSASASGSATLTFSGTRTIQALVMSSYDDTHPVSFDIFNDANVKVASGSLISTSTVGEFVGVHFITPVTTSSLRFVLTGSSPTGFTEIIPLDLPEPASLGLMMVGGLMLLKRRRAR